MEIIEQKMQTYFEWLQQNYKYKKLETSTEITTPFKNHLNDYIRIYADLLPDNHIRLSDDGQTFNELDMLDIDLTKTRKRLIHSILNQFNLSLKDDEIITNVDSDSFPQSKHNLIQGILKIYDLTLTTKSNVSNLFYEEVFDFFYNEEITGSAKVAIPGETGIKYSIDFIIPGTKSKSEKLVNFSNNLDYNRITSDLFAYRDVKNNRPNRNNLNSQMLIIANDLENTISKKAQQVADYEGIQILKWSNKDEILNTLK